MNYLLILCNIILLVGGQTLWKIGIGKQHLDSLKAVILVMFSPWVIAGLVLYVIATVIWIYLLSKMSLSLLYPMQSLAYVAAILVSIFIFKEHVSAWRWAGVAVILAGVSLVVK
ncbi:EamA family transporter [Alicyclobacillus tolerans]|uniref:EamA-like transporter family protein n=2 Tax=Alicyclobacillus tolerans TaxID=90970 RepID=A0A1M6MD64_9BACL|nr:MULTISPECIES: EamA family transporter [Alicyclobacillus]MDP9728253.1 drug/metabolite transporter (DMT)-like permease [Alicyclobacillus tengchongensis]QRF23464.1 EamA family transporter [Alicyclobacillus sp. TC]SHJ81213.1 EamA-like transporter family protein [Alicyclobacillus montanus]